MSDETAAVSDETAVEEVEEAELAEVDEAREALVAEISEAIGDGVVETFIKPNDDIWIRVSRDAWVETVNALKDMGFGYFSFLSAIDWMPSPFGRDMDSQVDLAMNPEEVAKDDEPQPIETGYAGGDTRFQVFIRVNDVFGKRAITVKCDVPDDDLSMPTIIPIFPGANWHEREAAEMFGITFVGHPNPRHLYLPGAFEGHPMRKDFALLARRIKPWPGIVDVEQMPGDEDEDETVDAANSGEDA